ncbi:unnamed protein product [Arabidopsis thaliana]|uniref:Uncharacterized protein n=1 Tax=Arabidopsis thaliana TaxID=3702 RepID=A0A5S9X9B4_ARATH|nr:unnamed protein product [Arabidopsis thaliana]VYS56252.1 unnamed protein product [Arabidopsis thaliana]
MSQPSTSIDEMSFSYELFVKLYCDRVELQPFGLVNLWNRYIIDEDEERHNFGHKGELGHGSGIQGLGMAIYWKHDLSLLWPISQLTEQCGLRSNDDLNQKTTDHLA